MKPGRTTRFERKLLYALGIITLGSMLASLYLARRSVRDAYSRGVNEQIHHGLELGEEARREHLLALRDSLDGLTLIIARDPALEAAVASGDRDAMQRVLDEWVSDDPRVQSLSLAPGGFAEPLEASREPGDEPIRTRAHQHPVGDAGALLDVRVGVSRAPFDALVEAGEVTQIYGRLLERGDRVSAIYLWVYAALLVALTLAAAVVGITLGRRVTRRVTVLADAMRRVGRGDLAVRVPVASTDEVGELTSAVNEMVRDLADSRQRIDYLKRIGAWQEFARRLAHEIKNPLTPIQLAAQEMQRSYPGDDARYEARLGDAVDIIEEEVATLRRLVSEFSEFARLPAADLAVAELSEILGELERSAPAILEDAEATGRVRIALESGGEAGIEVDAMMLRRALDNLVRNAVQALGDGEGEVRISSHLDDEWVTIAIDDDGPGIPDDQVESVFDPYFTTKASGTGLGLPIVKKIVLEHHGTLEYSPSSRGGARFEIRLPREARDGR